MRLPKPKEKDIKRCIADYLYAAGWSVWPIEPSYGPRQGTKGMPDLYCARLGVSLWVEVKGPGKQPSEEQVLRIMELHAAGILACVAWDIEDVRAYLEPLP